MRYYIKYPPYYILYSLYIYFITYFLYYELYIIQTILEFKYIIKYTLNNI